MAPKNKKKNSFYYFMKEIQEREAANGHKLSLQDLPSVAHPLWKNLSLAEREPYEEMARRFKNDPSFRGGKLASDGTRVEDNVYEEEEKIRKDNKMKQDVKQYCNPNSVTKDQFIAKAPQKLLYFMSFNVLCIQDDGTCIPIEIGIVEYSVQHGIHREYTKILKPGFPPTGYAGLAKQISEDKHEISIFGEDGTEGNMTLLWDEIKSFINPVGNDEYPPLFSERSEVPVTIGCLDWLASKARDDIVFEVWDATYLLMELRAGVGSPLPSVTIACDLLNKTSFNYHPSTRCDFHEEKDNHFCALSYSKRLCYLISDAVCSLFNVQLTEKHIPTRAVEDKAYTITVIKDSPRSDFNPVRLDKQSNYYQNKDENKNQGVRVPPVPRQPRQPASICIAEEMNRLHLNITAATAPGHGIGRGIRRN